MLDIVGAIFATAYAVAQAVLLTGFLQVPFRAKVAAFFAAALWLAAMTGLYAAGGLPPGLLGPVPINLLPFAVASLLLFATWLLFPDALASAPLPALIALHIGRIGGLMFILLYSEDRLSAPFGPIAGGGDIATGIAALMFVAWFGLGKPAKRLWLAVWNAFGAADLVIAITIAVLSAPGTPYRIFADGPGTQIMGTLPWVFVPAILVPVDFLAHALIARKLRSAAGDIQHQTVFAV